MGEKSEIFHPYNDASLDHPNPSRGILDLPSVLQRKRVGAAASPLAPSSRLVGRYATW